MKLSTVAVQPDPREQLGMVADRQVRYVVSRNTPEADAVFEIVKQRISDRPWSVEEWDDVVDELDRCTLTVSDWIAREDARPVATAAR